MSKRSQTIHIPQYLHHKSSGTARVRIAGREYSLGKYDSPSSYAKYDKLIAEWRLAGCPKTESQHQPTVNDIVISYWEYAINRYDGSNLRRLKSTLRTLRRLYGETNACEFGPKSLKAVQAHMDNAGACCRTEINSRISRIRNVFKWAASDELIPIEIYQALTTVEGLRNGYCNTRERNAIKPVPIEHVNMIHPFVSRQVWAVIQMQLMTGARGGEILCLRSIDVDTSGKIWIYQPASHKNAYRGHQRRIYIGPRGKEILGPFLIRPVEAFCFSPQEAEMERLEELHQSRKTPLSYGNRPGTNRRLKPQRKPGMYYTSDSYRRAIQYACDKAFPPPSDLARKRVQGKRRDRWETDAEWRERLGPDRWNDLKQWQREHRWHPHQLRHSAATYLRKEFGLDAARIILGHRSAAITETYAERDEQIAIKIMMEIG